MFLQTFWCIHILLQELCHFIAEHDVLIHVLSEDLGMGCMRGMPVVVMVVMVASSPTTMGRRTRSSLTLVCHSNFGSFLYNFSSVQVYDMPASI